ncbi:MAG: sigma-70 family RNA polymerase sigma factor [Acidobacteriota bacterium]
MNADAVPRERPDGAQGLDSTAVLLIQVRAGDSEAERRLIGRYLNPLQRWAHGRLPQFARSMVDTDDLVQITLIRSLRRIGEFEPRRRGAFLAYLRRILLNQIQEEVRRAAGRPRPEDPVDQIPDSSASPLERAIGRQAVDRYEAALANLTGEQKEAVILRVEMGFSYPEVAEAMGANTPNAARMLVVRGLVRLAEVMHGSGR